MSDEDKQLLEDEEKGDDDVPTRLLVQPKGVY